MPESDKSIYWLEFYSNRKPIIIIGLFKREIPAKAGFQSYSQVAF